MAHVCDGTVRQDITYSDGNAHSRTDLTFWAWSTYDGFIGFLLLGRFLKVDVRKVGRRDKGWWNEVIASQWTEFDG